MRTFRSLLAIVAVACVLAMAGACSRTRGNLHVETGRARLADAQGQPRPRVQAIDEAQRDAHLKLLKAVELMPASGDTIIGDHLARDPVVAARVQALILAAPRLETRYPNETVEVDLGVNIDQIQQAVQGTPE